MSSQQTKTAGRRTPLTLGPAGKTSQARNSGSTDSKEEKRSTPVVAIEKMDVKIDEKQADNVSVKAVVAKSGKAAEDGKKKEQQPTKESPVVVVAAAAVTVKAANGKEDKSKVVQKNGNKKEEKSQNNKTEVIDLVESGKTEAKPKDNKKNDIANGKSKDTAPTAAVATNNAAAAAVVAAASPAVVRESPRQKEIREKEESESKSDKQETDDDKAIIDAVKVIEKTVATPSPTKTESKTSSAKSPKTNEVSEVVAEISPKGKILKSKQGPPTRARVSPFKHNVADKLENASIIVNLSTVSEQTTDSAELSYGSLRHISGRKSLRPLRDIQYQHKLQESYRKIPTDFNDSSSSMNVTVGSEIPNYSFRTPIVAVKGRKRFADGEEDDLSVLSPSKKSRLDFSGFLSLVASPVTLLRARFSHTKIQCSTPNKGIGKDEVDIEAIDDKLNAEREQNNLNISGIETDDVAMKDDLEKAIEIVDDEVMLNADNETEKPTVDEVKIVDVEDELSGKNIDEIGIDSGAAIDEDAPIEIREPKKSRCNVM